ncbi:phage tail spike protein [Clostridium perfringens]|uniref:phage tail spike protein n=1 Tax=Clostridium perfringens TaxID=1502 RepID=UPI003D33F18E
MNDGKVRISVFPPDTPKNVVLTSNGHSLDRFCLKSEGFKDLAGNFRLEANFINSKERPEIEKGHIIKVLDEYDRDEIFRVTTFNPGLMVTELIAFQITITESQSVWLKDVRPTKTSGNVALNNMYSGADSFGFSKEMIVSSDITDISTAYYQKMTLFKAIYDCDQSFINRWGGETLRHQYNLSINKQIGQDNGVTIREGKNLLGFKANTNVDSLCTVAVGQGFDGIEGDYIASPLKDKYPRAYPKVIEYSDVKVRNESDANDEGFATLEEAKSELNRRIKEEFSKNHIDEVKATYDIEFLQLEKTEEYKNYAGVEITDLGDIVRVYISSLDLTLTTRVVEKTVNYLNGHVLKTKLSNNPVDVVKSDSQILADIRNTFVKNNNSNLGGYIDAMIRAGLKNSFVINKENETYWLDNKDVNLAKNVVRINKNGLACSQNGINGPFEYGLTIDGKFNASMITTGILSTILIQNADGSFQIDLSGKGGALFRNNGKDAILIENNAIKMFNWKIDGQHIGGLTSLIAGDNKEKPLVGLTNSPKAAINIGYEKKEDIKVVPSYIQFDKYNVLKDEDAKPIRIWEDIDAKGRSIYNIYLKSKDDKSWITVKDGELSLKYKEQFIMITDKGINIKGDLILDGIIKNSSGQVAFDPNAPIGGGADGDWQNGVMSSNCFRYLKGYEGLGRYEYRDSGGVLTIGYGVTHSEPDIYAKLKANEPVPEELAAKESYTLKINRYGKPIVNKVKALGCTTQQQFDALVDLAFNAGTGVIGANNSLMNAIRRNPTDEAYIRPIWENFYIHDDAGNRLEGLRLRRIAEANIYFQGRYEKRQIPILGRNGNPTGSVVTENNGDGWLPPRIDSTGNFKTVNNAYGNGWIIPVTGGQVTALFGHYPSGAPHSGTDFGVPEGTPVRASKSGTVIKRRELTTSYGKYLFIDHGGGLVTIYAHNSELLVNEGDTVKAGQVIAKSGTTGNSTGPHCHWELRVNGTPVDVAPSLRIGDTV